MLCIQKNRILIKHYQLIITLESTIFECKMNQQIISIKGKNIEIDAARIINDDIESIISDLQIKTS